MKLKLIVLFLFPLLAHSSDSLCRDGNGNPLMRRPFAIRNNCNAYHQCQGGVLATIPCPTHQPVFDASRGRCGSVSNFPECTLRSRTVCERRTRRISCPSGSAIAVKFGIYGRRSNSVCGSSRNTNCNSDRALQILKDTCDNRRTCQLRANNGVFGDPCRGVPKYIQINYYCRPVKEISTSRRISICEHGRSSVQSISCPVGQALAIHSGFYGRFDGTTCPSANIRTTSCNAPSSLPQMRAACDGKRSCSLRADNAVFGDPCVGTPKYLEAVYSCRASPVVTVDACENQNLEIACPKGQTVAVLEASYGRSERLTCFARNVVGRTCNSRNVIRRLRSECNDEEKCAIRASNSNFGDPCVGQRKYLRVRYQCS